MLCIFFPCHDVIAIWWSSYFLLLFQLFFCMPSWIIDIDMIFIPNVRFLDAHNIFFLLSEVSYLYFVLCCILFFSVVFYFFFLPGYYYSFLRLVTFFLFSFFFFLIFFMSCCSMNDRHVIIIYYLLFIFLFTCDQWFSKLTCFSFCFSYECI
jgi:hypothetical protein